MRAQNRSSIYRSGEWEIDLARRELRLRGVPATLGSRAFEVVKILVQSAGELVDKYALMDRVWPGATVEENTLQAHISAVRRALGADRDLLKTVAGRGYRLLGEWSVLRDGVTVEARSATSSSSVDETNLPASASDLVGRSAATRQLRDLVSTYRAITLTGVGGIGKTALALEVARELLPFFDEGVWLVELNSLSDPDLVPSMVAHILKISLGGDTVVAASIARAIGERKLLIVIDNCEHLIDAVAALIETIIKTCSKVCILATSREVLRIEGEYVYRVPPLDVPALALVEVDEILNHSAVQLFMARVTAQNSELVLNKDNLSAIAGIVRRLDGMPLAIEFAAARTATLGLEEVARRLDDRFNLLTSGRRTSLPRQRTLRATLDWSYELLPSAEQHLLRHLAVFAGGFTIEAANAVAGLSPEDIAKTSDQLANLIDKSLLTREASTIGARWKLLETIHVYAHEKLTESGEAQQAARNHARYFRDLISRLAGSTGSKPSAADLYRMGMEIDNVRAALDWSFAAQGEAATGIALAASYTPLWLYRTLMVECRGRAQQALAHPDACAATHLTRARLLDALGTALIFTVAPVNSIKTVLAQALDLAEMIADVDLLLQVLWSMWTLHFNIGDCDTAKKIAERFAAVARQSGHQESVTISDRLMANTLQYHGEHSEARQFLERVLPLYAAADGRQQVQQFHYNQHVLARTMLARTLWMTGLIDTACGQADLSFAEAVAANHEVSRLYPLGWAMVPFSLLAGDLLAAERSLKVLTDLAASYNTAFWKMLGRGLEARLRIANGDYSGGQSQVDAAIEECLRGGWTVCFPELLAARAEGIARRGDIGRALATMNRAIAHAVNGGECWYLPELHRVKGEFLALEADRASCNRAESSLLKAMQKAQTQGSLFWELRAGLSLARLKLAQGNTDQALARLEPIYARFTEGFHIADLRAATSILASLGSRVVVGTDTCKPERNCRL